MNTDAETLGSTDDPESSQRFYVPELDGLRFVAFLFVFLFHRGVDWLQLKSWIGSEATRSVRENGWVGVQLFFILSGYLITTLLLREEARFGRVDLRAFWIRRILRIWPLYYFTVGLTFLVIPLVSGEMIHSGTQSNFGRHFVPFLGFAGNWSMIFRGPVATDAQSVMWSVCVEEQFYLIVPLLVALLPRPMRIPTVLVLIGLSVLVRGLLARAEVTQLVIQYNTAAQFDTLLSGVLLAMILGPEPRRRAIENRWVGALLTAAVLIPSAWVFSWSELGHRTVQKRTWDFVAIWSLGSLFVATLVLVPSPIRTLLSKRWMVDLGRISYGLYMFHEVGFLIRDRFSNLIGWFPFQGTLLPVFALALTIAMARLSYFSMETRFLRLKGRWTRVPSRPV